MDNRSQKSDLDSLITTFPDADRRANSGCRGLIAAQIRVVSLAASPARIPKASKKRQQKNVVLTTKEYSCFKRDRTMLSGFYVFVHVCFLYRCLGCFPSVSFTCPLETSQNIPK